MNKLILLTDSCNFKSSMQEKYRNSYEKLSIIWIENKIQIIRSSIYEFDIEKNIFFKWEFFDWEKWVDIENIKADLIWYKSNTLSYETIAISEKNKFINNIKLVSLANDKLATSNIFSDLSPKTWSLWNIEIKEITDTKYIVKPNWWSWWKNIEVVSKNSLIDKILKKELNWYIVQEFLDLSVWIKGVVKWIHDVRVTIIGNEIFPYAYIREPKKWDFKSNISQWWKSYFMEITKLSKSFLNVTNKIKTYIDKNIWKWFYSIDLANTDKWIRLIEINSSPWVLLKEWKIKELYFERLIEFFII